MDQKTQIELECLKTLDLFMDALNAGDASAMDATMHFPHVRFTRGSVKVYPEAGSNPMDLFQKLRSEDDWKYSTWRHREIVQFDDAKAHAVNVATYCGIDLLFHPFQRAGFYGGDTT